MSKKNIVRIAIVIISLFVFISLLFFIQIEEKEKVLVEKSIYMYESTTDGVLSKLEFKEENNTIFQEYVLNENVYLYELGLNEYKGKVTEENDKLELAYLFEKFGEDFELIVEKETLNFQFKNEETMMFTKVTKKEWEDRLNRIKYDVKSLNEKLEQDEEKLESQEDVLTLETEINKINNQLLTNLTNVKTAQSEIVKYINQVSQLEEEAGGIKMVNCDDEYTVYCDVLLLLGYADEIISSIEDTTTNLESELVEMQTKTEELIKQVEEKSFSNVVFYEEAYFKSMKEQIKTTLNDYNTAIDELTSKKEQYNASTTY